MSAERAEGEPLKSICRTCSSLYSAQFMPGKKVIKDVDFINNLYQSVFIACLVRGKRKVHSNKQLIKTPSIRIV